MELRSIGLHKSRSIGLHSGKVPEGRSARPRSRKLHSMKMPVSRPHGPALFSGVGSLVHGWVPTSGACGMWDHSDRQDERSGWFWDPAGRQSKARMRVGKKGCTFLWALSGGVSRSISVFAARQRAQRRDPLPCVPPNAAVLSFTMGTVFPMKPLSSSGGNSVRNTEKVRLRQCVQILYRRTIVSMNRMETSVFNEIMLIFFDPGCHGLPQISNHPK